MNENKTGGAAFPTLESLSKDRFDDYTAKISQGMTLRDYFAAKALPAAISSLNGVGMLDLSYNQAKLLATYSYSVADAMLEERSK